MFKRKAKKESPNYGAAVSHLVSIGINFLAVDFDQTMIDIHTGGRWKGTSSELATHVRPVFIELLKLANAQKMQIAIVTFSHQTQIISEVLETHFSFAQDIVIRARDNTWWYEGNGMTEGKQPYMASAVEELSSKNPEVKIEKNTTLLIDDDFKNIELAGSDGVRGVHVIPEQTHLILQDILELR
ncbi:hypothetical protein CTEN210_12685 [Chaetoceros tenuissimus]|uniref:Uncharacterized protein n=1 Tax=Chaetoceros tenuissimus TaxID=426638 RepID=A0AAD3HAQ4_9STRA|nr:hypothetical protein CTEN210_12685 [Chaetoceros tenuissimus]